MKVLALTWPAAQFAVTPRGVVFAGYRHGRHRDQDRFYVSGLSQILDDAADLAYLASGGAGGRFFVQGDQVELAADRSLLATLRMQSVTNTS
ncbi:MAG: hypothetical protein WA966_14610 [Ornithinimicrobium sp.]